MSMSLSACPATVRNTPIYLMAVWCVRRSACGACGVVLGGQTCADLRYRSLCSTSAEVHVTGQLVSGSNAKFRTRFPWAELTGGLAVPGTLRAFGGNWRSCSRRIVSLMAEVPFWRCELRCLPRETRRDIWERLVCSSYDQQMQ